VIAESSERLPLTQTGILTRRWIIQASQRQDIDTLGNNLMELLCERSLVGMSTKEAGEAAPTAARGLSSAAREAIQRVHCRGSSLTNVQQDESWLEST
jgi:hypothetical protein